MVSMSSPSVSFMPTILIADDNSNVRRALRSLLQLGGEWEICGEAKDGGEAIEKVRTLNPDLLILDLAMPVMNGLDAAREIRKIAPNTRIVLYTMHANHQLAREAESAAIDSIVPKSGEGCRELLALMQKWLPSGEPKRSQTSSHCA
jgi:DNA-binding NarL/FixJ family response regulator